MNKETEIKKFQSWKNKCGDPDDMTIMDYISFNFHPEDLLILSHLLFPEFIEFDGCLLWKDHFNEKGYIEWMNHLNNDRRRVKKVINHLYIYDLFGGLKETVDDKTFEQVGKLLQRSWKLHLSNRFPNKKITVEYSHTDEDYGPLIVVFQQETPEAIQKMD